MAIGRRAVGQRRVALALTIEAGVIADPAVDLEQSDLKAYRESLWDTIHLKYLPGERPTLFTIRALTKREKDKAEGLPAREAAAWLIRCGVVALENYQIMRPDGTTYEAPQPDGNPASEKWMDELDLPQSYLFTLAAMIRAISEAELPLPKASVKPCGDTTPSGTESTGARS